MRLWSWLFRLAHVVGGHHFAFILCYHGVGTLPAGIDRAGLFVCLARFEEHLGLIRSQGYDVIGVSELGRAAARGDDISGLAAITFDDALQQTAEQAVPRLQQAGMTGTVFVPTGLLGRPHPDLPEQRILDAAGVRELSDSGVEIGAHSVDHVWLPGLARAAMLEQMRRSRMELEDIIGRAVTSMAYPYGAYDPRTMVLAREAGYEFACACGGAAPWESFALPREPIHPSTNSLRLRIKMAGLYGPVHTLVADRGLIGRGRRLLSHPLGGHPGGALAAGAAAPLRELPAALAPERHPMPIRRAAAHPGRRLGGRLREGRGGRNRA